MTVSFVGEGGMAGALLQPSNTPLVVRGSVRGWGQCQGVGSVSGGGVYGGSACMFTDRHSQSTQSSHYDCPMT